MPSVSVDNKVYQDLRQLKEMNDLTYSGVIGSLLRQVNGKSYDILDTKDSGLIGALGETIAWQYLWDHGINAIRLGYGRPAFWPLTPEWTESLKGHLTQEQIDLIYPPDPQEEFDRIKQTLGNQVSEDLLQQIWERTGPTPWSWDFVGWGRSGGNACLVEVKTSRPGSRPGRLEPEGRRGMTPQDLREAKHLGFVMLLVTVELTDSWEAVVRDQEIFVDG
jgi:hypothetical protein